MSSFKQYGTTTVIVVPEGGDTIPTATLAPVLDGYQQQINGLDFIESAHYEEISDAIVTISSDLDGYNKALEDHERDYIQHGVGQTCLQTLGRSDGVINDVLCTDSGGNPIKRTLITRVNGVITQIEKITYIDGVEKHMVGVLNRSLDSIVSIAWSESHTP